MLTDAKTLTLIGYGKSNEALCRYLISRGIFPTIRNREKITVPHGCELIVNNYLDVSEELAFRSPALRPDMIKGSCTVSSEAELALSITKGHKIGITGSDGKTTTSTLIFKMLECAGKSARLCGNIGTPIIDYAPCSTDSTYTVCELSSFQLFDMSPVLDTAVITNISENHLDWHTDLDEYIASKARILENAERAVLNYDSFEVRALYSKERETVFFTRRDIKAPRGAHLVSIKNGSICYDGIRLFEIDKIRLRGDFNTSNIQASIGALYGIVPLDAIIEVATSFSGVENRMELVKTVRGVSFINSSIDSTPARTVATLGAFDKSKCVLILGGYDKNLSYEMLSSAFSGIKYAVLCGANAEKIYKSIKGSCRAHITTDFTLAVREAYSMCDAGDFVLLSPASASFDMFENYKERAKIFKEIVRGLK